MGYVYKLNSAYNGTKKHTVLSPIFKVKNLILDCWKRLNFSKEGNVFVRGVCVGLFHLLTAEQADNKDYLTETSIDKWYTFLKSFQSTNSYFISFSKALNNL